MKRGIFMRTFVLVLLVPSLVIIAYSLLSIPRERNALLDSLAAQSRGMISTATEINANAFVSNDFGAIVDIGGQIVNINPAVRYLLISRSDGPCIVHTQQKWEERRAGDALCATALASGNGIAESNPVTKERVYLFNYPLRYSGIDWGYAQLGISPEVYDAGLKSIYVNILFIATISVAIAALFSFLFARQLTNPLLHLRATTDRIMQGDLTARADMMKSDEIGMLAKSFNAMTESMVASQISITEARSRLESILASMSEGLIVADHTAIITMVNHAAQTLVGLREEQLIGQSIHAFFAENAAPPLEALSHDAERLRHMQDEYSLLTASGEPVPILFSAARIPETDFIVCVLRDIRERKRSEMALKQLNDDLEKRVLERTHDLAASEEKYRQLIENSIEAIFVLREGAIVYANTAMLSLFSEREQTLLGTIFIELVDRSDSERLSEAFKTATMAKQVQRINEFCVHMQDGKKNWIDMSIVAITWEGYPALLNFMTDITEERSLREQLLQAQKMEAIGTLAGGLAHDFNNLLQGIMGHLNLLQRVLEPEHPSYERVQRIEEHVQSASRLTKQLLGLARGGKYEVEILDVNVLIRDSGEMFGRTRREIEIKEVFSSVPPLVSGDRGQLEQVLLNLFVNAWHAMPGGGALTVSTRIVDLTPEVCQEKSIALGRYVEVAVEDNGSGMDERTRQRIFEPFFTTRERGKGSGLGLASSYGIIKNHEGAFSVHSELGKGTRMSFYLPLRSAEAANADHVPSKSVEHGSGTVLIVDDQELASEVVRDYLQMLGYATFVVSSGAEALQLYSKHMKEIDLVLLDMIMPGMSGIETFAGLKKLNKNVKVILSSGYSEDGQAAVLLAGGCNGFIQKPFRLEELSQKVESVLKNDVTNPPAKPVDGVSEPVVGRSVSGRSSTERLSSGNDGLS